MADAPPTAMPLRTTRATLFLVGFLILFLELACIRWFAAYVIFLQFFTNLILIASFVGMSIGCAAASQRADWLSRFPWIALGGLSCAIALNWLYRENAGFAIDVGDQLGSPQEIFFGTEYRAVDLTSFVVPIEAVAALFFTIITLLFIGPGQVLGRCFDRDPDRVRAYTLNIGGSLAGIAAFALASYLETPPAVWFLVGFAGIAALLAIERKLRWTGIAALVASALVVLGAGLPWREGLAYFWSPYYWVAYEEAPLRITVNNIGHQQMHPIESSNGSVYSLIHLLNRDSGAQPFADVLIIGAGSGNDVTAALRHGAQRIDAVEIDPVIARLGQRLHPDRPYQDPRVRLHLNDGRNFLRETSQRYDLVIYALVDSLVLHSSISNIRLESFLFTEEAFRDVQSVLKPGGIFVSYNFMRQGWIVDRISRMMESVFAAAPVVIALPNRGEIRAEDQLPEFSVIIAGAPHIQSAFQARGDFWLSRSVVMNERLNGFGAPPSERAEMAGSETWDRIAPATVVRSAARLQLASDNWPFLYLYSPSVPWFYVSGALLMGFLGLLILYWQAPGHSLAMNGRMFFLGAAFLLLETKAVVHLALVFGSTWVVNSLVFAAILVMILAANLYVLKVGTVRLPLHYAALFAALALNMALPLDAFLAGGILWRYAAPSVLVMAPMFFAGVIFAMSFRASTRPDRDFAANIAGAVVGGFSEYLSMLLGFQNLLLVAIAFYALSAVASSGQWRPAPRSA